MNKSIYSTALLAITIILVIYLFQTEYYRIFPSTDLVALSKRELRIGGIEAMKNGDDPISAIVLYDYSIIGRALPRMFQQPIRACVLVTKAITYAVY